MPSLVRHGLFRPWERRIVGFIYVALVVLLLVVANVHVALWRMQSQNSSHRIIDIGVSPHGGAITVTRAEPVRDQAKRERAQLHERPSSVDGDNVVVSLNENVASLVESSPTSSVKTLPPDKAPSGHGNGPSLRQEDNETIPSKEGVSRFDEPANPVATAPPTVDKEGNREDSDGSTPTSSDCNHVPALQMGSLYPLRQSGCTMLERTDPQKYYDISHCAFRQLRLDPTKIASKAHGGEPLDKVMGQAEEDEYLRYQHGAFVSYEAYTIDSLVPSDSLYYINDILTNMEHVDPASTSSWQETCPKQTTSSATTASLFIQRYDYVNFYHTILDIWNTWEVYRQVVALPLARGDNQRESASSMATSVVFLDAHAAGLLDDVWETLFGRVERINTLLHTKNVSCFASAYFIPTGYVSRLGQDLCKNPNVTADFVRFVLDRYDLQSVRKIPGRISIIDRTGGDLMPTHPRAVQAADTKEFHNARTLDNLGQIKGWIQDRFPNTTVQLLALHNMTFREQLRAIRESEVVVGHHGAGLTHLLFLDSGTFVLEIPWNRNEGYVLLSEWKANVVHYMLQGVEYTMSLEYFEFGLCRVLAQIYPALNDTCVITFSPTT